MGEVGKGGGGGVREWRRAGVVSCARARRAARRSPLLKSGPQRARSCSRARSLPLAASALMPTANPRIACKTLPPSHRGGRTGGPAGPAAPKTGLMRRGREEEEKKKRGEGARAVGLFLALALSLACSWGKIVGHSTCRMDGHHPPSLWPGWGGSGGAAVVETARLPAAAISPRGREGECAPIPRTSLPLSVSLSLSPPKQQTTHRLTAQVEGVLGGGHAAGGQDGCGPQQNLVGGGGKKGSVVIDASALSACARARRRSHRCARARHAGPVHPLPTLFPLTSR